MHDRPAAERESSTAVKNLEQLLDPSPSSLAWSLLCLLGMAVLSGAVAAGVGYVRSRRGRPLLPPQRRRAVPWSGGEVIVAWIVYYVAITITYSVFSSPGILTHVYGPEFPSLLKGDSPAAESARNRVAVWATVAAFPLQLFGIFYVLRTVSGTRLYQLGWTTHRPGTNLLLGVLAWLIFQPLVLGVNDLVTVAYKIMTEAPLKPHPLEQLARSEPLGIEWALLVLTAVVVAPVLEELLCRGILQPWAASRSYGANNVMVVTFLVALGLGRVVEHLHDWNSLYTALQPAGFVVLMLPGYLLVRYYFRAQRGGAIYATALLFGSIHANNWPTPVALFVLGLGLGWLAYRTQSLVGPMLLHMLFNGVACVLLFVSQGEPAPSKGSAATEALRRSPVASTWSAVPGSQLPRRRYARAMAPSRGESTAEVTVPASVPSRNTADPDGTARPPSMRSPSSVRLTWPRSRAMTIGSWPR
jgi:membrane protease YdiL (CAAX protease family)